MEIAKFDTYGNYSSNNYGANSLVFTDANGNRFWFSYKTLMAFDINGTFVIRQNDWATTTGKHLNWIDDDKSKRVDGEEFEGVECLPAHAPPQRPPPPLRKLVIANSHCPGHSTPIG